MRRRRELLDAIAYLALAGHARGDEAEGSAALVQALPKAKVTLADGIKQAAQLPAAPISAKFQELTYDMTGAEAKPKASANAR
jgi:hypothetical protein